MITPHRLVFGYSQAKPNTFIGGIAKQGGTGVNAPIDTAELLAIRLGINVSRITGFKVIGDDVQCKITGNYNLNTGLLHGTSTERFTNLTSYIDNDKLLKAISNSAFNYTPNFKTLVSGISDFTVGGLLKLSYTGLTTFNFPDFVNGTFGNQTGNNNSELESIIMPNALWSDLGNAVFGNNPKLRLVDLRSMRALGRKTTTGVWFTNSGISGVTVLKVNQGVLNVPEQTGGGLDSNVAYVKNTRGWIVELYDDNGNYIETL